MEDHSVELLEAKKFLRELLSPEYEFRAEEVLRDLLKRMSLDECRMIAEEVYNETNDPRLIELLRIIRDKGREIEREVEEESKRAFARLKEAIREYVQFIKKYADPNCIEVIDVDSDLFFEKMLGKKFTILDVLKQDLGGGEVWVYAIIDVNGELYLFRDMEYLVYDATTGEGGKSLGLKLTTMLKWRKLPLRASVERRGSSYKWKIVRRS